MNRYKSRWDMTKQAWTKGHEEACKLKLDEDYNNWTPLMVHLYQLGMLAGLFALLISITIGAIVGLIIMSL